MDLFDNLIKEGKRRNLSHRTITTYLECIKKFLKYSKKDIKSMTKNDVVQFLDLLIEKERASKTINVYHSALKFLFNNVLNRKWNWRTKYSKSAKRLPIFLTKQEMKLLIDNIKNDTHKLAIELLYSSGLRVSELTNLKVKDLQIENNYGFVREGKGRKDRLFIIALKLKDSLKEQIKNKIEEECVFTNNKNQKYSDATIRAIIKKGAKKAFIKKPVSCHTLRHSFATHLIENGYDVASVQSLLGHNSSQTTMIYIHMASPNLINVKSPYDTI